MANRETIKYVTKTEENRKLCLDQYPIYSLQTILPFIFNCKFLTKCDKFANKRIRFDIVNFK